MTIVENPLSPRGPLPSTFIYSLFPFLGMATRTNFQIKNRRAVASSHCFAGPDRASRALCENTRGVRDPVLADPSRDPLPPAGGSYPVRHSHVGAPAHHKSRGLSRGCQGWDWHRPLGGLLYRRNLFNAKYLNLTDVYSVLPGQFFSLILFFKHLIEENSISQMPVFKTRSPVKMEKYSVAI